MSDCERLKNDLAYNQCLAMFGPAAKNIAGGGGGGGAGPTITVPAAESNIAGIPPLEEPEVDMSSRHRRYGGRRTSRGRQSASFEIGGGDDTPATTSRRRWHRHHH